VRRDYELAETPEEFVTELAIERNERPYAMYEATDGECVDMACVLLNQLLGIKKAVLARLLGVSSTALAERISRARWRFGGGSVLLPIDQYWRQPWKSRPRLPTGKQPW
jgi:hypothetical protein